MSRVSWKKKGDIAYCGHEVETRKNSVSIGFVSFDARGAVVG